MYFSESIKTLISTKIRKLELNDRWTISRNSSDFKENVFVKLEKDGVTGYGEAAPNIRYGENAELTEKMIHQCSESLLHLDLFNYTQVKDILDESIVAQNCAKAAVDMALMDWISKSKNMPLYKMLGLDADKTPVTSYSIGIDKLDRIKTKTAQASDYPILKIKVGTHNDEEIINAVRSITSKPIRVDANEGWKDKETAVKKIEWMQTRGVEFVEQPMPAMMLEETAWLRERVDLPLVADEAVMNTADIPLVAEAYDGINIKLMKAGGIQETLKMIHSARAFGLKVMIGCMIESSIAITAAAHLSSLVDWADLDGNLLIKNDPFCGVKVSHGRLILNDQPGMGVTGPW
ncbi:dipeptide epimerase [bacterium]|nr:dipeptide epimerase [bacterium]